MNKSQFQQHLNLYYYGCDYADFIYLTNRKVRKKGYVSLSTLKWYCENGRMGDLLRKVDKETFEAKRSKFNETPAY